MTVDDKDPEIAALKGDLHRLATRKFTDAAVEAAARAYWPDTKLHRLKLWASVVESMRKALEAAQAEMEKTHD